MVEIRWKCKKCGKITDWMPEGNFCDACNGFETVNVLMNIIVKENSTVENLFQCPLCKTVCYNANNETICKEKHNEE